MNTRASSLYLAVVLTLSSGPSIAGGSAQASAQALEHSFQALGYSVEGAIKLVSGAVAIPLMTAGAIGQVSAEAGEALWEEAESPPTGPLPISDEVVTVGPSPAEQLQQ